jgi:hypothetical protein
MEFKDNVKKLAKGYISNNLNNPNSSGIGGNSDTDLVPQSSQQLISQDHATAMAGLNPTPRILPAEEFAEYVSEPFSALKS